MTVSEAKSILENKKLPMTSEELQEYKRALEVISNPFRVEVQPE